MKLAELPVFWMILSFAMVGILAFAAPTSSALQWPFQLLGILVGLASALLIRWAMRTMSDARTAIMPGQTPSTLVTTGPFAFSRNPIYLGMVGLIAALALLLAFWPGLFVALLFGVWIDRHFIRNEEARIVALFDEDFRRWSKNTRRWL